MSRLVTMTIAITTLASLAFAGGDKSSWSYTGKTGPEHWGTLDEHNVLCAGGVNQTPINLENFIEAELENIKFHYDKKGTSFLNNGHTVQVNFEKGNSITIEGKTFELVQYHFHTPSENHIQGKSYPMEVHLVHADKEGNLAVVGVMFEVGKENRGLSKILKNVPHKCGEKHDLKDKALASDLLPKNREYYRFNGSLTTPPCSENVHWFVMKESVSISKEQLKLMEKVMHAPNNRPIQSTNARPILQ